MNLRLYHVILLHFLIVDFFPVLQSVAGGGFWPENPGSVSSVLIFKASLLHSRGLEVKLLFCVMPWIIETTVMEHCIMVLCQLIFNE